MSRRVEVLGVVAWFIAMALALQGCLSEIGALLPQPRQEPPRAGGECDFCEITDEEGCFPGRWTAGPAGVLVCVLDEGAPQ